MYYLRSLKRIVHTAALGAKNVTCALLLLWILSSCNTRLNEQPLSWAAQLVTAQNAAKKVDSNAVLWHISAAPAGFLTEPCCVTTDTLRIVWDFYSPSEGSITVTFDDTAVTSTLMIDQKMNPDFQLGSISSSIESKLSQYSHALDAVHISPREAIMRVQEDAVSQAAQRGMSVVPIIGLDLGGSPPVWNIQYRNIRNDEYHFGYEWVYTVDAESGEVLKRDYKSWSPEYSKP